MGVTTDTDVLSISDRQRETERNGRIRQLEHLNATLVAEVNRMHPVVTWAMTWNGINHRDDEAEEAALAALSDACDEYETRKPK